MNIAFCTIVTKYRLNQCIALCKSLKANTSSFTMFILCVDNESYDLLDKMQLESCITIKLESVEDSRLLSIKTSRKLSEYCWTLKPALLLYLFDSYSNFDALCYVDSDIYFFGAPNQLLKHLSKHSVLLSTHKVNRKCNGGFVCFKRDRIGYSSLLWWKEKCLEWCYAENRNGGFGDQGYLDSIKLMHKNTLIIDAAGANVAPWNYYKFDITDKNGEIYVNNSKLIFYHFSGFRMKSLQEIETKFNNKAVWIIYHRYIQSIKQINEEIECLTPDFTANLYLED